MSKIALPNNGAAPFGDMSELDASDIDIIGNGVLGNGVLSGCAVTAQASPDATAAIASGVVSIDGQRYSYAGGNSPAVTADATNPRVAVFGLQVSGNNVIPVTLLGTPFPDPPLPTIPASTVALKYARIPAASAVVQNANMLDKTMLLPTTIIANAIALGASSAPGNAITAVISHTESGGTNRQALQVTSSETLNTTAITVVRGSWLTHTFAANVATTALNGMQLDVNVNNGNAAVTRAAGLAITLMHGGVSPQVVTNSYGVLVTAGLGGGTEAVTRISLFGGTTLGGGGATVTNLIGLDLSNLGSMAATNVWGIQVGNYQSYHYGAINFGSTDAPDATAIVTVRRPNGYAVASPGTDVSLLIKGPVQTTAVVTHIGLRITETFGGDNTSKPSYIGLQVDPSSITSGTAGIAESVGARIKGQIAGLTADLVIGVDARVRAQGVGTATLGVGVAISGELANSGAVTTMVGLQIANLVGTTQWGMQVGNYQSYHQGRLMVGAASAPAVSAALEINSTTGALLLPRMTTTQRNALTAVAGMKIYNATTQQPEFYDGTAWQGEQDFFVGVSAAKATARNTALTSGTDSGINFVNPQMRAVVDATNNKVDVFIPAKIPATPRSGQWLKSEGSGVSNSNPFNATQDLLLTPIWAPSNGAGVLTITELGVIVEALYTALTLSYGLYSCDNGGFPVTLVASTGTIAGTTAAFKNVALSVNYAADPLKYWIGVLATGTLTVGTGTIRTHAGMLTGVPQVGTPGVGVNDNTTGLRVTGQASMPNSLAAATFANVGSAPVVYATVQ